MPDENKKRGKKSIVLFIAIYFIILLIGVVIFFSFYSNYKKNTNTENRNIIVNPAEGLSLGEAVKKFDDGFIYYLLVSIKAYNLHEASFSDDFPKIKIMLGDEIYYGKVQEGKIYSGAGDIEDEDIVIYSSKEEIVKIMQDKEYAKESFREGRSKIELKSNKLELYTKGYLDMYDELK